MNIDVKKFLELNKNYIRGVESYNKKESSGRHTISFNFNKLENFFITKFFTSDYINKYQDMFCKVIHVNFNVEHFDLDIIHKNNIQISGDLYDLYKSKKKMLFFVIGSKRDIKNRVAKSFFDKEISDFLFDLAFNALEYTIVDLPRKNIKYNWKKKDVENYSIINIFAEGHYSSSKYNKICFLPLFNWQSIYFRNEILNIDHYIYELDGKHSEVKAEIEEIKQNNILDYLDFDIDINYLEIAFNKYQENKLFLNLSFDDFVRYQHVVLKSLKENTSLTLEEKTLMDDFVNLIEKMEKLKPNQGQNFKLAFKFKYPQYSRYI